MYSRMRKHVAPVVIGKRWVQLLADVDSGAEAARRRWVGARGVARLGDSRPDESGQTILLRESLVGQGHLVGKVAVLVDNVIDLVLDVLEHLGAEDENGAYDAGVLWQRLGDTLDVLVDGEHGNVAGINVLVEGRALVV